MTERKPCPFCGHEEIDVKLLNEEYYCKCRQCKATTCFGTTKEAAIKFWNRRIL